MIFVAQALNYTLAVLFWLILGRVALTLITHGREGFVMGIFVKGTEPVFATIRFITGGRIGEKSVVVIALLLIVVLRIALLPALRG